MRRAIYPGSFDPVTEGHLDIIRRSCRIFDEIVIALLVNPNKKPMFTIDERIALLQSATAQTDNSKCQVRVATFQGLLVHFAREQRACAVVRGLRAVADYEYELQMAQMNRRLAPEVETVFLMAGAGESYISSRLVKEVFQLGGDISGLVPPVVERAMHAKKL